MQPVPSLLTEKLNAAYDAATVQRILRGFEAERPVTLRVNPLRSSRAEAEAVFRDNGIAFENVPWYEDAYVLPHAREDALSVLPLYEKGGIYLQNLSAMLPPLMMGLKPGESVLDMAAAPGGKTTQMAAMTGNGISITACERNPGRAERLRFNLERQGAGRVTVLQQDARQLDSFFSFDRILLDAPCSGSGTLLLKEEKYPRTMTPAWFAKLVQTQKGMLKKALSILPKGHEMVYSTCSVLPEENEGVLESVLDQIEILPADEKLTAQLPLLPVRLPGVVCVCPAERYEGFFAAHIRKK